MREMEDPEPNMRIEAVIRHGRSRRRKEAAKLKAKALSLRKSYGNFLITPVIDAMEAVLAGSNPDVGAFMTADRWVSENIPLEFCYNGELITLFINAEILLGLT
jgi:hypothetical protein